MMRWEERVKGREQELMVRNANTIKRILQIGPVNPCVDYSVEVVKEDVRTNFALARMIGLLPKKS